MCPLHRIIREVVLCVIPPQVVLVLVVGAPLVNEAVKEIKALPVWPPGRFRSAQPPLTYTAGRVAGLLQYLGNRDIVLHERRPVVSADGSVAGVLAGHQRRTVGAQTVLPE